MGFNDFRGMRKLEKGIEDMKKFRTVFFYGYQRDEVDGYVESLTSQIEDLKNQLEQQEGEKENLKKALEKSEEELKNYKDDYLNFMDLMVNMKNQAKEVVQEASKNAEEIIEIAKKDAKKITSDAQSGAKEITEAAQSGAEEIVSAAKAEADTYLQDVKQKIENQKKQEEENWKLARYKLMTHLDAMKQAQEKLLEVYEQLGKVVGKMPLRLGDVWSDEPFELLEEHEKSDDSEKEIVS